MTEANDTEREKTVRALYAAYIDGRKDIVAAMLAEDFTFSSPRDDHIDRDAYFDRCWPTPPPFSRMEIEYLGFAGSEAVVRYLAGHPQGILETARIFALMHSAATDSIICTWQQKRDVGFWRPFQAISGLYDERSTSRPV